jgi:hypothetical protein
MVKQETGHLGWTRSARRVGLPRGRGCREMALLSPDFLASGWVGS